MPAGSIINGVGELRVDNVDGTVVVTRMGNTYRLSAAGGTANSWDEVLANGRFSGANNPAISNGQEFQLVDGSNVRRARWIRDATNGPMFQWYSADGTTVEGTLYFPSFRARLDSRLGVGDADPANATTDADELAAGITSAANQGITIFSSTIGSLNFGDAADNDAGRIRYNHGTGPRFEWYVEGVEIARLSATAFELLEPGITATVGDGTGQGVVNIDSAAASDAILQFRSAGLRDWQIVRQATTPDLEIERYIAGALQDTPYSLSNSTGNHTFDNDVSLSDGVFKLKSTSGFSGEELTFETDHKTSTDAATNHDTTIGTIATNQEAMNIDYWVVAARSTGNNFRNKHQLLQATRTGGAVATANMVAEVADIGTGSTTTSTIVVSGDNVLHRWNGNAAETWNVAISVKRQLGGKTS